MMKAYLPLFGLITFLFASCNTTQQSDVSDLQRGNIKGNVQSFEESLYTGAPDETEPWGLSRHVFNEQGNMVETVVIDPEGHVVSISKLTYDDQGRRQESTDIMYDTLAGRSVYKYDGDRITEINEYNSKGELQYTIRKEKDGNQTISRMIKPDGSIISTSTEQYQNNLLTQTVTTDAEGNTQMAISYTRDKNGDVIAQTMEGMGGSHTRSASYRYDFDQQNNWVKKYHLTADGEVEKVSKRTIVYN